MWRWRRAAVGRGIGRQQKGRCAGDAEADTIQQVVAGCIIRPVQCRLKSHLVGRTMALEHQAAQPQQSRTVVTAVINTLFKGR